MSEAETGHVEGESLPEDVPTWDDEYIETVSRRLMYNYDLEKDRRVEGEQFSMYGKMEIHNQKHFLHPAISIAHHVSYEHLFVRRVDGLTERDVDRLVQLGHTLAEDWVDPSPEHYSTEFTFVSVVPELSEDVRSTVAGLDERTMLKYGYNGHYDVNLVVASPDTQECVANDAADVAEAFRTWDSIEREEPGLLGLLARRLQL